MKRNLFLISMLIPAVLPAGNLLRNSSFELDGAWFGSGRCIEITGAKIPDPGPEFKIDSSTSTQGKKSLKLDLKKKEEATCWRIESPLREIPPGSTLVIRGTEARPV